MTGKKMLWRVDVHREEGFDSYRVLATDDLAARHRAIKVDDKINSGGGGVIYCEMEIVSHIDV